MLLSASRDASALVILFILWGVSPYGIWILSDFVIRKVAVIPQITKSFCVISILLLIFTAYACYGTVTSKSSTAALAFIFLPLYLNILVIFLLVTGLIWAAVASSSKK